MLSLLLAAATSGAFTFSDTTDNITGEREVYALQISKEVKNFGELLLRCDDGTPRLVMSLYDTPETEWVTITAAIPGGSEETPLNFRLTDKVFKYLSYQGDSDALVQRLTGNQMVAMTAHYDYRSYTFTFSMDGIEEAWRRVKEYCPEPDV
jgi:hypothetical protein